MFGGGAGEHDRCLDLRMDHGRGQRRAHDIGRGASCRSAAAPDFPERAWCKLTWERDIRSIAPAERLGEAGRGYFRPMLHVPSLWEPRRLWRVGGSGLEMSRRSLLVGAAGALALHCAPSVVVAEYRVRRAMAKAIDAAVAESITAGASPGVAVQVALRGRTLFSKAYGLANLETRTPLSTHGVFRVGSLTKQFAAALVLILAERKDIDLDAPVTKWLPFFASRAAFTARELLHHTAGLRADESGPPCVPDAVAPKSQIDLARAISAQDNAFDFAPGTAWLYSNANYIVLGALVEQVTGLSLADAAQCFIFGPLHLSATAFDDAQDVVEHRVSGYSPVPGAAGQFVQAPYIDIAQAGAAGAMRSSVGDLCQWHASLFGERLLPRSWLDVMCAPGRLRDGRVSGANRFSPQDAGYGDVQYAMGLLVSPLGEPKSLLHYGYIEGFSSCLEAFPDVGVTLAILCNGDVGPNLPFRAIRRVVRDGLA